MLESIKKMFKEFKHDLSHIEKLSPPELACLGFNIADLDVTFKKS